MWLLDQVQKLNSKSCHTEIWELSMAENIFEGACQLGFDSKYPMRLYFDNKAVINIALNLAQHDRTKHIRVDRRYQGEVAF